MSPPRPHAEQFGKLRMSSSCQWRKYMNCVLYLIIGFLLKCMVERYSPSLQKWRTAMLRFFKGLYGGKKPR